MRLQKSDSRHSPSTTFLLPVCASQSKFRLIIRDLEKRGKWAISRFPGGFRASGRIGSEIARVSTSGTVLSRMRRRIHYPATNGVMAAVGGVHAGDASPRSSTTAKPDGRATLQ